MAAGTDTPAIARGIIRAGTRSAGLPDMSFRRGPDTADGYWVITRHLRGGRYWAARVVLDPAAADLAYLDWSTAFDDALFAEEHAAQDDYLSSVAIVAELPPAELHRLRLAVELGKAGGPNDGGKAPTNARRRAARSQVRPR